MLTITPQALERLKGVLEEQGQAGAALRVIVVPDGNGAQYMLALENEPREDDVVTHYDGLQVVVDGESVPLLEDAKIDYVEGLMRSGFVINNPSLPAVSGGDGCACGGQCACGGH